MRKVRESEWFPVTAFVAVDADGVEYLVDYDLFNASCEDAVRLGYAATLEVAEREALGALTPDMDCVLGLVTGPKGSLDLVPA